MKEVRVAGRFRKFLVASLVVLFTAGLGPVGARADTDPIASLRGQILKALTGSTAHLQGFYVSLSGLRGGAQLNAGVPFVPASNEKVFTGLAALLQLTPDFQLVTTVRRTGPVSGGVLSGDLVLQGVGDPLLSQYALNAMARRVADAGVRRVTGSLWAYDGLYDRLRTAPGWKFLFRASRWAFFQGHCSSRFIADRTCCGRRLSPKRTSLRWPTNTRAGWEVSQSILFSAPFGTT